MRKFKLGFTLAEVAAALVVVGVVAAAALPMTISGLQRQKIGPSIGKAVEQIEVGCQNIIYTANSNSADSVSVGDTLDVFTHHDLFPDSNNNSNLTTGAIFTNIIIPFMNLSPIQNPNINITDYSSRAYNFNNASYFRLKKQQIGVYLGNFVNAGNQPSDVFVDVLIDANAESSPNRIGEDIFLFHLTNTGKLLPHGTNDDDHYTVNCTDANIPDGLSCAARIVAEGYRKTY
ncbi:prepilin-type N-terminal cleavage/methylation domain-containing protein [bacterium]|nr:prepilin-type N-terminal cleavage/methylation domain-containing protein [bacterium]